MTAQGDRRLAVEWVEGVDSTQVVLAARARAGAEPQALATTNQTSGHGRRGRQWTCPPGGGLALSVLLRPVRDDAWTWLPLLSGVAVVDALTDLGASGLGLKWPNDVMAGHGKLAGLIAERVGDVDPGAHTPAFVLGIGLNLRPLHLPEGATSLADLGVATPPGEVADVLVGRVVQWLDTWEDEPGTVVEAYRVRCATLGERVRVALPGGRQVVGEAVDVDDTGCLLVDVAREGRLALSAGDVVHLRPG